MRFEELNLHPKVLEQIKILGYDEPTEVQEKGIPEILGGRDVVAQSETGSGKTAAFVIPIAGKVERGRGVQVLVLTPTRELCIQVAETFKDYGKPLQLHVATIYGGVSINPQIESLNRSEIVVATPGRLLDHMNRGLNLGSIRFLILDEVDKMFEMGFIDDVERIISNAPRNRQTLLFSATISTKIHELVRKHLHTPILIKTKPLVDKTKLKQTFYDVPQNMKFSLLVHLLKNKGSGLALIFCGTRRQADVITQNLKQNGIKAMAIHGGLTQNKREYALESLRKEQVNILVATDVAARGLDIKNVTHVYNYDSPKTSEEYIHRIGRTARAGEKGEAITLLSQRDYEDFGNVRRDHSLEIQKLEVPQVERVAFISGERGGSYGGRSTSRFGPGSRQGFHGRSSGSRSGYSSGQGSPSRGKHRRNESYRTPKFG